MKKLLNIKFFLLLLTFLIMLSCNSNYNNAVEYYKNAKNSNSQVFLDEAKDELNLIKESKKDDEKVIQLTNKINLLQKKLDSISYAKNQKRLDYENKLLVKKIEKEKEKEREREKEAKSKLREERQKYPNMVGKWRTYQTNYLSMYNGIVRIYRQNGSYFYSTEFDSGSREYNRKLKKSGNKYYEIGKSDYVVLKSNGDLEHRDKEGYLMTSREYDETFTPAKKELSKNFDFNDAIGQNIFKFRFEYALDDFETVDGTNNQRWITYYPKHNITIVSNKKTDLIEEFKFGNH